MPKDNEVKSSPASDFSQEEVKLLLSLVKKRYKTVNGRGIVGSKAKQYFWDVLALEFNRLQVAKGPRSVKELSAMYAKIRMQANRQPKIEKTNAANQAEISANQTYHDSQAIAAIVKMEPGQDDKMMFDETTPLDQIPILIATPLMGEHNVHSGVNTSKEDFEKVRRDLIEEKLRMELELTKQQLELTNLKLRTEIKILRAEYMQNKKFQEEKHELEMNFLRSEQRKMQRFNKTVQYNFE